MFRVDRLVAAVLLLASTTLISCSKAPPESKWAGPLESTAVGDSQPAKTSRPKKSTTRKIPDLHTGTPLEFQTDFLGDTTLVINPGVFLPMEANQLVLPFMKEKREQFAGKTVLEIGTGSGMISLYAAKLGAKKVVSSDISELALANAGENARRLGVDSIIETRLVPQSDMSAYSVIGPDESFDIIISNPPYALDLDSDINSCVTDRGDLGFSIVRGLEEHLNEDGMVFLLYGSFFYHHVMVKFARHEGYDVRHHVPYFLSVLEAETTFNFYLDRLLEYENIDTPDFRFDLEKDYGMKLLRVAKPETPSAPLLPGNSQRWFHGMIVIQRQATGDTAGEEVVATQAN
jgi:predicted RNA methylase